ncbi:putative Na+/H+ antiporter [Puniceicoccus vermicola]|uniref:Putative Na+/H+ antiporter n=1 Tax=Puniceicoccus vermicola TaxID=388746 RepID=A0A7X1B065_9BACT|nr:putative Na+/H+ antiporter [Puniceicoccus vermicola]MBC2603024.1 putative Na+/H+ antiporter [Puniceicoccus vermicola]
MNVLKRVLLILFLVLPAAQISWANAPSSLDEPAIEFPLKESTYTHLEEQVAHEQGHELNLWERLKVRAEADPFNLFATVIFLLAVIHTFLAARFNRMAHQCEEAHRQAWLASPESKEPDAKEPVSFKATLFHFLGEVEAIFGIWIVPLLLGMVLIEPHGWGHASYYIDTRNYTEAIFVVVIMAIASSRPVILFAESALRMVAGIGKRTPVAWWFSILVVGPLLGSFITEPAAMTISALLLGYQFYVLKPSNRLKYATLGLLFVNVSVGGTLTHFAAPPVLMVATEWHWNLPFMFTHFGWKAVIGIGFSTFVYFLVFRKELLGLREKAEELKEKGELKEKESKVPFWIILVHLAFVAWTVVTLHHPAFFVGGFLFFIAFTIATEHHQYEIKIKGPLLVGFFLAGLVTHGGLQSWWIAPVLSSLSEIPLFLGATVLTAFNDNAAITFLASQVPAFSPDVVQDGIMVSKTGLLLTRAEMLEYAVVAGAVTGGGLTVIANAPNPAGQSILSKYFPDGISPIKLLAGALFPTVVVGIIFMVV